MIRRCPNEETPVRVIGLSPDIKSGWETRGTEISKYPEEKKTIVMPLVAMSEIGRAQTLSVGQGNS